MKKELKEILSKIEKSKMIIVKERDKLRNIYEDLQDILYDLNSGIESFEQGKRYIENGIDEISKYF